MENEIKKEQKKNKKKSYIGSFGNIDDNGASWASTGGYKKLMVSIRGVPALRHGELEAYWIRLIPGIFGLEL